jgi:Beta-propeller repeat
MRALRTSQWRLLSFFFLSFILLASFESKAQTGRWIWARQAGGSGADAGRGVATDGLGNVYVCGEYTNSATFGTQTLGQAGKNGFLTKYDSTGAVIWAQSIANSGRCSVADVAADPAGNTYLIGGFVGTATFGAQSFTSSQSDSLLPDGFIVKLDALGIIQWAKHLRGSAQSTSQNVVPLAITATATGEIAICGGFERSLTLDATQLTALATAESGFLFRLLPTGAVGFYASVRGTALSIFNDVQFDQQGFLFLTGTYDGISTIISSNGPNVSIVCLSPTVLAGFVMLYFPDGRIAFRHQSVLSPGFVIPQSVATDPSGDAYVTGYFSQNASFQSMAPNLTTTLTNGTETFIAKLRRNMGAFLWQRQGYGTKTSQGLGLVSDATGRLYVSGSFGGQLTFDSVTTLVASDSINTYLAAFDGLGTPLWAVAGGKTARYEAVRVAVDAQRRLYITGQFTGSTRIGSTVLPGRGLRPEVFLARYDAGGPLALAPPTPIRGPLVIYPNPVNGASDEALHVVLPMAIYRGKAVRVRLVDRVGRVVAQQSVLPEAVRQNSELVLPIKGVVPGLYTLLLDDATRCWNQSVVVD